MSRIPTQMTYWEIPFCWKLVNPEEKKQPSSVKWKITPSLPWYMKSLLEPHILPENLFRRMCLDKLSIIVTQILTTYLENADLNKPEMAADKICEGRQMQSVNTTQKKTTKNPLNPQLGQILQLQSTKDRFTERMEPISIQCTPKHAFPVEAETEAVVDINRGASFRDFKLCYYHHKSDTKPQKCIKPCTFVSENQRNAYSRL